ncbi:MAG: DUF1285 domain-containing protein [Magnetospirillum sp.]|nr:DUF1285 domain-containing protein [Magnetospirillum sp.]
MDDNQTGGAYAAEETFLADLPLLAVEDDFADESEDCGDLGISIDRQGRWHYHGSPIRRKEMVCLFASMLERRRDGSYWLVTPDEKGRIEVADVPLLAVELFTGNGGRERVVSLRTNVDDLVTVDRDHPLRLAEDPVSGEPAPYVLVRDGIEARLARAVYYELVALGCEEKVGGEELYGIWSSGTFFVLGRMGDPA